MILCFLVLFPMASLRAKAGSYQLGAKLELLFGGCILLPFWKPMELVYEGPSQRAPAISRGGLAAMRRPCGKFSRCGQEAQTDESSVEVGKVSKSEL